MDLQERGPCETHKTGLFESTTEPKDTKEITMSAQLHGILFNQVLTKSPRKAKGCLNFKKSFRQTPKNCMHCILFSRVVILDLLHLSQRDKKAKTTLKMQHLVAYFFPLPFHLQCPQLLLSNVVRSQMHGADRNCHGNGQCKFRGVGSYDEDRHPERQTCRRGHNCSLEV